MSLIIASTKARYRNAFGILCSGFLICNLQAIFVHFTWCTIVLSVKSPALSSPQFFLVRLVGLLLNGGWFGSLFLHFAIAVNRFHAFVYATKYNQLWSQSNTLKAVLIVWTSAIVYCTHHLFYDCALLFNRSSTYSWLHYGQICGNFDAAASVVIVLAIACIDFITFIKILAYRRAMRKNMTVSVGGVNKEREILFFKQSCKLGLLYIFFVITFNVPARLFTDKWILFISGTISWILIHSLDGLIFLIFNWNVLWKKNFRATVIVPVTNLDLFRIIPKP
uniref:G_PROTEIN_RECEP_F1_2 domain-containing protein n=1 Tax=Onchocerca volvulus TaxID=6282 RepID=A0A2K6VLX1_ONCVO